MRQRLLIFLLVTLTISTGYFLFVRTITEPTKNVAPPEKIEETLARIYENFLHKTKYSYDAILKSGTDYSNQERVFVELTKKLRQLDKTRGPDYQAIKLRLESEIAKNQDVFKKFYLKVTKTSPTDLQKAINDRNKQYDVILEQ